MASLNLNKVILGGRLACDPELKRTPNGVSVTSFSLAVDRRAGKEKTITDFITVVAWRNNAEFISKYFHKGSSICIVGSIQTRSWNDNNGQKRYTTEIVVDEACFVDSKGNEAQACITSDFEELASDEGLPFN